MPKKRQTSIMSTSTLIQDTSKENDCIKPSSSSLNVPISNASSSSSSSQNSHPQAMKSQISSVLKVTPANKSGSSKIPTFLKKDSLVNKKKILRENITTALVNQIPHKKIRVSSSSSSNPINSNTDKESSSCYVNDSEMPCCSRSTFIYQKAPSSPSSSSSSSNGQMKITTFMPIKKVGVVKYGTNSKSSASTLKKGRNLLEHQNTTENSMSAPTFHSLSEKLIKKKKRLLKSETTLKRKKSRPQKPLV